MVVEDAKSSLHSIMSSMIQSIIINGASGLDDSNTKRREASYHDQDHCWVDQHEASTMRRTFTPQNRETGHTCCY